MNQRGSITLESLLCFFLLFYLSAFLAGVLYQGARQRLEEHAKFVVARKALAQY
jgi:hypothetical protein